MPTTHLDNELAAYIRGRRDQTNDVYKALEVVRRLGYIDLNTASVIIDHIAHIDQRAKQEMKEDGE